MKEKIGNIFMSIIAYILVSILTLIVSTGVVYNSHVIFSFNQVILIICVIVYLAFIILLYKKVLPWIEKIKCIEYLFFVIFIFLAIFSGLYFKVKATWDMGNVFNIAERYLNVGSIKETVYLATFPNNTMQALIEIAILVLSNAVGITDNVTVITMFNAMCVSLAVILSYYAANKMFGRKNALMHIILCVLTSPLFLYSAIYYTDTFSLPVGVGILLLWLVIRDKEKSLTKLILNILLGLLVFLGIKIKVLSIFIFIAIVVYELSVGKRKDMLKSLCLVLPIVLVLSILFNVCITNKITSKELSNKAKMPVEHWVMMGLNGNGNWNFGDYVYSLKYRDYDTRQEKVREEIGRRIASKSFLSHAKRLYSKIIFVWHDGTYWVPIKLAKGVLNHGTLHEIVLENGKYVNVYKYIPQTMHFGMLICIIIAIIKSINNKDMNNIQNVLVITVFGMFIFMLIWETRSRFLLNILLFMLILSVNGIEYLSEKVNMDKLKNIKKKRVKKNKAKS